MSKDILTGALPSLFRIMEREMIGRPFGNLPAFSQLVQSSTTYPPHNIEMVDENHIVLTLALAGFKKEQIKVETTNGNLVVTGTCEQDEREYMYKGIATRSFTREFKMGEYFEVTKGSFADGLLAIELERKVPDHLKGQVIDLI